MQWRKNEVLKVNRCPPISTCRVYPRGQEQLSTAKFPADRTLVIDMHLAPMLRSIGKLFRVSESGLVGDGAELVLDQSEVKTF